MKKNRAVFLDRDGTINKEVDYLRSPEQLALIPGAGEAIKKINGNGFKVIIVTNQSGVARGFLKEPQLNDIHKRLVTLLAEEGAHFDGLYYCPHHSEGVIEVYSYPCKCRKPETGMLDQAAGEHNIDLAKSYVIGDKYTETLLAHRVGAKGVLVRSGHGEDEIKKYQGEGRREPEFLADDLLGAVQWLLNETSQVSDG